MYLGDIAAFICSLSSLITPTRFNMLDQITSGGLVLCVEHMLGLIVTSFGSTAELMAVLSLNVENLGNQHVKCIHSGRPFPTHAFCYQS